MAETTLIKRSDKLAFMKVGSEIVRMKGFTSFSKSNNPIEYSRRYVDEEFEQTDVTGYSPSFDCAFDQYKGDKVHDYLVNLIDSETLGTAAVIELYVLDKSLPGTEVGSFVCSKRSYSVIAGSEGDSNDAYTYSFTLKVKTERVVGEGTLDSTEQILTFEEPVVTP